LFWDSQSRKASASTTCSGGSGGGVGSQRLDDVRQPGLHGRKVAHRGAHVGEGGQAVRRSRARRIADAVDLGVDEHLPLGQLRSSDRACTAVLVAPVDSTTLPRWWVTRPSWDSAMSTESVTNGMSGVITVTTV
jgi:hypothetical protein